MKEDRYLRHNLIDWFSQEKLNETKIAVVGAGAVGNEVIKNLALLGVGEIHIFDFDIIKLHNLTRSVLFRESDVGLPKAEVAAIRARELDPNLKVVPIIGDFWDRLTLADLQTFDVLYCCVDNFEARIRCNTLCLLSKVDFVNVGIDSRYAGVEVYPFSQSVKAGCFECNLPASVYGRMAERFSCGHLRKISFIEKKIPTTIITSTLSAGLATSLGLRLGERTEERTPTRYFVDTISGSITRSILDRSDSCPCCGQLCDVTAIFQTRPTISNLIRYQEIEMTVTASDPILVSYAIVGQEERSIVFARASDFDSEYPSKLADDPDAIELEVRDQFTLSELMTRFEGYSMPCKYAIVTDGHSKVLWEFEGEKYERS